MMKEYTDPLLMFEHTYAEMPPHLAAQREAFIREMEEEKDHG
jgi:hypothetical protein